MGPQRRLIRFLYPWFCESLDIHLPYIALSHRSIIQVNELFRANFIGRGQVWYLLNEFFLVLEAIQTGLEQIFKRAIRAGGDEDVSTREHADIDDVKEDAQDLLGGVSAAFPKQPPQLPDGDWNVYCAIVAVRTEFEEKFKAMWA